MRRPIGHARRMPEWTLLLGLLAVIVVPAGSLPAAEPKPGDPAPVALTVAEADRLAQLPLKCLGQEYPCKPGETLASVRDVATNRARHPVFYGCFDWHSAVHGHWMLVKLLRTFPGLKDRELILERLEDSITAAGIRAEVAYFERPQEASFERTYGWAWLLKLAAELHETDAPWARRLERNLQPLTDLIVRRCQSFLPKLVYPVRVGEHANTAFFLAFAWDYAVVTGNREFGCLIERRARDFFLADVGCPLGWEPSGFDFFSPCLEEADLLRRVLGREEFAAWLGKFLPELKNPAFRLTPGEVGDRSDGKLVHLDGLNLSRAWCLFGIAAALPEYAHLCGVASDHLRHSLPGITDGSYAGEHWLASFAIYALSCRPAAQ